MNAIINTYNAVTEAVNLATNMAQNLSDDWEAAFDQAIQGTQVSVNDLQMDLQNFQGNLIAAIQGELENGLNGIMAELQDLGNDCQQALDGNGLGQDLQDMA